MYDSQRELIDVMRAMPDVLAALLREVSPERARTARGGDEDWSVLEVVCHLRDAEAHALGRMRAMRDAADPVIGGFDQEAWARQRRYEADDLGAAFAAFRRLRSVHVAELAALVPEQWQRPGRHERHGAVTIGNHTLHTVWHDAVHSAQIARQLAG